MTDSEKVASILFDIGSVILRPRRPFRYSSGVLSPVYTDNRLIISHPKERKKVVDLLIKKLRAIGVPDVIAGTATAGIPHAAFISQELNLPMIYVRSEPKEHGKGNQIEGKIMRGQSVIIVEDLISTGGSSIKVAKVLKKAGAKVIGVLAIFTYDLKEAQDNFKKEKIKLYTLTNLKDTTNIAVKTGYLKKDQVEKILDWAKDPAEWGKKMGFK